MATMVSLSRMKIGGNRTKKRLSYPLTAWLADDEKVENLTFPQCSPSMICLETLRSLDSKVPVKPGQDEAILRTTKVGTKLYQKLPGAKFDLRMSARTDLKYNNLHDPHLKNYFLRPHIRRALTKTGAITGDGFVRCSPQEYNTYRQWIRRLKVEHINAEAQDTFEAKRCAIEPKAKKLAEHAMDILEANRQKLSQDKKIFWEKMQEKEKERDRVMKTWLHNVKTKEHTRIAHNEMKRMKCKDRAQEEEIRRWEHMINEEIRLSAKILALAKKEEQCSKRIKEREDVQTSARRVKEYRTVERWKVHQYSAFKLMEDKKAEEEKEMSKRRENVMKRSEMFNREWKRIEEQLARAMHSSRELAYEKLQKANMFLRKMEQRKETELLKWKQKRDAQKPRELSACRPAKSQRQPRSAFHMKSNWTIGECLKGYNDKNLKLELVTINVQDEQPEDSQHVMDASKLDVNENTCNNHISSEVQDSDSDLSMESWRLAVAAIEKSVKSFDSCYKNTTAEGANERKQKNCDEAMSNSTKLTEAIGKKNADVVNEISVKSEDKIISMSPSDEIEAEAQRDKLSVQGRRPTPIYSKTTMKRLLDGISAETYGMEVYGEDEEDEEEENSTHTDPSCCLSQVTSMQNSPVLIHDAAKQRSGSLRDTEKSRRNSEVKGKPIISHDLSSSTSLKSDSKHTGNAPKSPNANGLSATPGCQLSTPEVRQSRSRLSCRIYPSLNSNCSDIAENLGSPSSGELIGCLDESENEAVMKIEMPEVADDMNEDKNPMNRSGSSTSIGKNTRGSLHLLQQLTGEEKSGHETGSGHEGNNEGEKNLPADGSRRNDLTDDNIASGDDETLKSFVVINENDLKDMKEEFITAEDKGAVTEAVDGSRKGSTMKLTSFLSELVQVESSGSISEQLTKFVVHDEGGSIKSDLSEPHSFRRNRRAPIRTPSVHSMTVLSHRSEPSIRKRSLGASNRKSSAVSLPGKTISSKVSIDKPNFDSPRESGLRHVTSRLSVHSRRSSLKLSAQSSLAMNPLQEKDDGLPLE